MPCFTAMRAEIALMSGSAFAVTHHAFSSGAGRTSDGNGSHASTLKSPSYTKSVSWQHYPSLLVATVFSVDYSNMPPAKIPMRVKALRSIKNRYLLPRHCLVIVTCMVAFLAGRRNMSASRKGMWGRLKYHLCFQMIKPFSFLIFCQRHGRQQKMCRSNKVQALQSMVLVLWDC
ncbi:putative transposase [Shigella flexneri K-218]|nr:putative transposase [Shigella flexneri K-218]